MTTLQSVTSFESILQAMDFEQLEPTEQEDFLLELNALIFRGSLIRLVEQMDDETREAFNTLVETNPTEELMEQFLMTHVPDADKAVADTVEELTSDILAVTSN
jgi:hypothetical protein